MASLRRLSRLGLLAGVALVLWAPGCGKQNEGERCDYTRNNDQDCESPLVCVQAGDLFDTSQNAPDRCCPREGEPISDDRCVRATDIGTGGTGGGGTDAGDASGGEAGQAGAAGGGGVSGGGGSAGGGGSGGSDSSIPCEHSSDCLGTGVCGPTGVCQPECINNLDCPQVLGLVCNLAKQKCEFPPPPDAGAD